MDIQEIANTIIRGEKALQFPLKREFGGWVSDSAGHHIFDMRGWGYIQYMGEGAEKFQDEICDWIVKTLNEKWEQTTTQK